MNQPLPSPQIVIRKYANRRLYDTSKSSYVTIDDLTSMVRAGTEFTVVDSASGQDLTRVTLMQIMLDIETEGHDMLPIAVLRMFIQCYGSRTEPILSRYLERVMLAFVRDQQHAEDALTRSLDTIHTAGDTPIAPANQDRDDITALRAEFTALKEKFDKIA